MNNCIALMSAVVMSAISAFGQIVDTYAFKMNLKVPRIYSNTQSLGYRKYQPQTLRGTLKVTYQPDGRTTIEVLGLVNKTHAVNGIPITYVCYDYPYEGHSPMVVVVGSNRTGKFETGAMQFSFQADPSYNIGAVDEDNTLMLELSGVGKVRKGMLKTIKGSVKGQIGCGCRAYGHLSPTRVWLGFVSDYVVDVAPLYGTFSAQFLSREGK